MSVLIDIHVILAQHHVFDTRGVAKRFRYAAIFDAFNALELGEVMRSANDHDPPSFSVQIGRYCGPCVDVGYVTHGPGNIAIDFMARAAG